MSMVLPYPLDGGTRDVGSVLWVPVSQQGAPASSSEALVGSVAVWSACLTGPVPLGTW